MGLVRHGFTHFELEIEVYFAELAKRPKAAGRWIAASKLGEVALPTVMRISNVEVPSGPVPPVGDPPAVFFRPPI